MHFRLSFRGTAALAFALTFASSGLRLFAQDTKVEEPAVEEAGESPETDDTAAKLKEEATVDEPAEGTAEDYDAESDAVLAGHSIHGEAFNEGPRQHAYLMPGLGNVRFPVTTENAMAQRFITQGVAQLHGFWYFEAERSFREAAFLDPDCAMAYWGMAMANTKNAERAKGFIAEAVKRKENATEREAMYIDALEGYHNAKKGDDTARNKKYTDALEQIVFEYPDDIEAKALVGLQIYLNKRAKIPVGSYLAANALLEQVLAEEPMHPCHHFIIHLWDGKKPAMALNSAARCGQAAPAIAHMWHMPGHIYSKLKRYGDAAWQQEASARVDHAHMMRDRIMPDQIHNFAHNNEWLIRNLMHLGRVHDAIDLAKNMIELPRHPTYNHFGKRGSASYGRMRLFEVLTRFELWGELQELCESPYFERTENTKEQIRRLRYLGKASFRSGNDERGQEQIVLLEKLIDDKKAERDKAGEEAAAKAMKEEEDEKETKKAREDARKKFSGDIRAAEQALNELKGHVALSEGDHEEALKLFKKASGTEVEFLVGVEIAAGKPEAALKRATAHVKKRNNEVAALVAMIEALQANKRTKEVEKRFEELRTVAAAADLDNPVMKRMEAVAESLDITGDWRNTDMAPSPDTGVRPDLAGLGPFRWQPSAAEPWSLTDATGHQRSLADYKGRPVVVVFYLGVGCLHCAEQLQAFAPKTDEFKKAGISLIAISTDDQERLTESQELYNDEGEFPFPLVSDSELNVFRQYRVYDDFEGQPLHGTFLIDGDGMVLWQDISYEPFNEPDFLVKEGKRLLAQRKRQSTTTVRTEYVTTGR